MPNQEEVIENGSTLKNDPKLIGEPEDGSVVDCVIAEVKGPSVTFNTPISGPDGPQRITTALKMFGVLRKEDFVADGAADMLAHDLHKQVRSKQWKDFPKAERPLGKECKARFRMLVFAPEKAKQGERRKHLALEDVLDFVRTRMKPGAHCGPYARMNWRGWTRHIVNTIDEENRGSQCPSLDKFVECVLQRGTPSE